MHDLSDLLMEPFEAVKELQRRREDPSLAKKVEEYLSGDIPEYFRDGPILYMARYIVTPNFETMRFTHLFQELGLKIVASQDSNGLFVSQNQVKRALCKLPVLLRVTQKADKLNEQFRNITIVDFNTADGKLFSDIETLWGERLIDFHHRLFSELKLHKIETHDDAAWIDRHHRENLLEHYKHLMALFVVHGVFFENYDTNDDHEIALLENIIRPACRFVENRFGCRPIMAPIFPTSFESSRFWIGYPREVLRVVKEDTITEHLQTSKIPLAF